MPKENSLIVRAVMRVCLISLISLLSGCFSCSSQHQGLSTSDTKAQKPIVAVQVSKPQRQDLVRKISLSCNLVAYEQATLFAKVSGYLKWIRVDKGDSVKKGAVLALIEVPEIDKEYAQTKAQYEEAKAEIDRAKADYDQAQSEFGLQEVTYKRIKEVREQEPDVIPQQEVDVARGQFEVARSKMNVAKSKISAAEAKLNTARAVLERTSTLVDYGKIRAPFDGIVTHRHVDPGALIQVGTSSQTQAAPVVTVVNMDTIRVYVDVPEREVPFVRKGNPAAVTVDALPGKNFSGSVTRFATALDPATRTMKTEIQIPNANHVLRPGMYGNVALVLEKRTNVLTVQASSLTIEGDKKFVYVVVHNKAKKTPVSTGFDDGTRVEIPQGLTGDEDIIITKGIISDGLDVKVVS